MTDHHQPWCDRRRVMREDRSVMGVWFVIAVPIIIMLFALGMERVEYRLRNMSLRGEDVEEFLEQARPDEVRALYGYGIGRALELFRLRRPGAKATKLRSRHFRG